MHREITGTLKSITITRSATGKYYAALLCDDGIFEAIQQGPFVLKGINDIVIKYIRDDSLNLIREDANGEVVIDTIKNHDNKSPSVRTVFFYEN